MIYVGGHCQVYITNYTDFKECHSEFSMEEHFTFKLFHYFVVRHVNTSSEMKYSHSFGEKLRIHLQTMGAG